MFVVEFDFLQLEPPVPLGLIPQTILEPCGWSMAAISS